MIDQVNQVIALLALGNGLFTLQTLIITALAMYIAAKIVGKVS